MTIQEAQKKSLDRAMRDALATAASLCAQMDYSLGEFLDLAEETFVDRELAFMRLTQDIFK